VRGFKLAGVSPGARTAYDPPMTGLTKPRMTVDEYLAWAEERSGHYELVNGTVYAMAPERAVHAETKLAVHVAFLAGIKKRQLPCHVLPDGMTVRIDDLTAYEPDASVYCGARLPASAIEVTNPIIVVEVLSPSSQQVDLSAKLAGYFRLPSVAHYLIIDPDQPLIIHHARSNADPILTRIVREGAITLDPPGLELALADVYGAA
jgi:Uma2 family endonuclease